MNVDELRYELFKWIEEEYDVEVHLQGKRIIVENDIIILVTKAKVAA